MARTIEMNEQGEGLRRYVAPIIGIAAFVYYVALSAKSYTWVFISSDSGDWLMCSNWFVVPQPYGSPLYILLMRLLGTFPGDTVIWATVLLSVIPSATTVALVYLIVNKLVGSKKIAVAASVVLLGSGVFLTQSTILEEYTLTTMLLTLSFWFYLNGRRYLTALCWGLAASIHAFVLGALLFWLIIEWREYTKPLLVVTAPIVAVFYGFILLLMYLDTPRLLAGGLNVYSLRQYLTITTGAILGQLSIFEAPKRLLLTSQLLLMSFGLALIPLVKSVRKPIANPVAVMLGIILWTFWYFVTNIDPAAWTFITYASPFIAILVGLGLSKIKNNLNLNLGIVVAGALVLMLVNGMFLNADKLTSEKPLATDYYDALMSLPNGSIVVCEPGGYSLGLYHAMSENKNLIPLVYPYIGHVGDAWGFDDYRDWLNKTYNLGLDYDFDTLTSIAYLKSEGYDLYFASTPTQQSDIRRCLTLESTEWLQIKRVVGLSGLEPSPTLRRRSD